MEKAPRGFFLLLGTILLFLTINFLHPKGEKGETDNSKEGQSIEKSTVEVKIAITGDLMCHQLQIDSAKKAAEKGSQGLFFDFFPQFEAVALFLQSADCTIGNLETTISTAEKGYFGYPLFRTPANYIETLKRCGFDILTTANNHSLDGESFGVDHTIKVLDSYRIAHTGTYSDSQCAQTPLFYKVKGILFAHLAFTYALNGNEWKIPKEEQKWRYTLIQDSKQVKKEIELALKEKPDFIIAHLHWGDEYQRFPNALQRRWAQFLGECGVDIIAGSHPHVLQPIEKIKVQYNGKEKEVLTLWSLGNCIAHMGHSIHPHSDYGMIWNLYFEKELSSGKSILKRSDYLPIWVHLYPKNQKEKNRTGRGLELLPLWDSPNRLSQKITPLSEEAKKRYSQAYQDCCELMNQEWFTPLSPDSTPQVLEEPFLQ